jgi:nitroimidazol reductase NimA-like FMN-containing flavoprotein (pyridoxamine 5'-phosphate oxidase superfamily)
MKTSNSLTAIRRRDRAIEDDAWIRALLRRAPFAALATVHDGQPFINTNTFVYDERENAIFLHTARTGRTSDNVGSSDRVCVSVSEMGRIVPADTAFSMSVEYAGVTVFGRATLLADNAEKHAALRLLLDKYVPHLTLGVDYADMTEDELARTSVYRVEIEAWSGKQKQVAPDYPGAFTYGERHD